MNPTKQEEGGAFEFFLEAGKKLCSELSIREDFILDIYNEPSDWAFIVQVDALHETSCREIVRKLLKIEVAGKVGGNEQLDRFIETLGVNGRTSLLRVLEAGGCPSDHIQFIEHVRSVRNLYAHDVKKVGEPLLNVILQKGNGRQVLKAFSAIQDEGYDETDFLRRIKEEPRMLRFSILSETLRFMTLIYLFFFSADTRSNDKKIMDDLK